MADILVIHEQVQLRQLLLDRCRGSGHRAVGGADLEGVSSFTSSDTEYSVVLLGLPKGSRRFTTIDRIRHEWPAAAVIVIGSSHDTNEATEAIRLGADEYVGVPVDGGCLASVLAIASGHGRLVDDGPISADHHSIGEEHAVQADPLTQAVFAKADRAATVSSTVLITGESGTGKEVLARRIHRRSARRQCAFVPVNCGSLPETLIETELFGYKRGAFTGATADTKGLIEEAKGGVLFLDEIGDMPLSAQVRLLRFLDSGEIRSVGGTCIRHVETRVIAATNRELSREIREKRFREDLFFRLSVISLHLPPLRERRADIPPLVQYHIRRVARKLQVPVPEVSDEARSLLVQYDWPGNIRELQNALEQALVQDTDRLITPDELPSAVQHHALETVAAAIPAHDGEHDALMRVLRRYHGNQKKAAAALGISRTTLWRLLRQLNGMDHSDDSPGPLSVA